MTTSGRYIFRNVDTVGAAAAEDDDQYLDECFLDTGDLKTLLDCQDPRSIIVGRTGSGKSALLYGVKMSGKKVIEINPENLALNFISNSTILKYLSQLGLKLDIFYKLLWRHVFVVEILKQHLKINNANDWTAMAYQLIERFKNQKHAKALKYLEEWGEKFWEETEVRIKDITTKLEQELEASASSAVPGITGKAKAGIILTEEERRDVVERAQIVINKIQLKELSEILDLVNDILDDEHKTFYITIDDLDCDWVDDVMRYRLIRSLIDTVRDFHKIRHAKIIMSLRLDLIERVFRLTRDSGFQEEKYESLILRLSWSKNQLIEILDKRIHFLVKDQYTKSKVGYLDIMPQLIGKKKTIDFLLERTMMRPRDIILFFNQCIHEAVNRPNITVDMIHRAEGEYSRGRMRSLFDEWFNDYPGLVEFIEIIKKQHKNLKVKDIALSKIADICLDYIVKESDKSDLLSLEAKGVAEGSVDPRDFRIKIIIIFYKIGLIGFKSHSKTTWSSERRNISSAEISDDMRIEVHPMYWRVLGVGVPNKLTVKRK